MKRFLILSILIVFVTVSSAGSTEVRWTKPDFHQDQFEKDREDCIQAVKDDLEQKMTVEECLAKKGYESKPQPPSNKEKSKTDEIAKTVAITLLGAVLLTLALPMFPYLIGAAIESNAPKPKTPLNGFWFKPDADRQQLKQDYSECRGKAEISCMEEKGYTRATY